MQHKCKKEDVQPQNDETHTYLTFIPTVSFFMTATSPFVTVKDNMYVVQTPYGKRHDINLYLTSFTLVNF